MEVSMKRKKKVNDITSPMNIYDIEIETKKIDYLLKVDELEGKKGILSKITNIFTLAALILGVISGYFVPSINNEDIENKISKLNDEKIRLDHQIDDKTQKMTSLFSLESKLEVNSNFLSAEISRKELLLNNKDEIIEQKKLDITLKNQDIEFKGKQLKVLDADKVTILEEIKSLKIELKKLEDKLSAINLEPPTSTNKLTN